jgi:hypothetical protein
MRLTLEESNEPPEGVVLNAEITSVKEVEKPWINQRTGEKDRRIAFEFTLLDDKYAGRKVWEDLFTSFYASPKCQLYAWTLKILNREELPEGFTLDTAAFEGARVPIIIKTEHFTKKNGDPGSAQRVTLLSSDEAQGMRASSPEPQRETVPPLPQKADDDELVEPF